MLFSTRKIKGKCDDRDTRIFSPIQRFLNATEKKSVAEKLVSLEPDTQYFFISDGAWSEDNILERVLQILGGNCEVYIFAWTIGLKAVDKIKRLKGTGMIKKAYLLMDKFGNDQNVHANLLFVKIRHQFDVFKKIGIHAKGFICVAPDGRKVTCVASSNYTDNQTIETGHISTIQAQADFYLEWYKSVIFAKGGEE